MEVIGFLILFIAWIWSVAKGIQVSLLCSALNFFFPPISQAVYAIYEDDMRGPFTGLAIGIVILFFTGSLTAA